MRTSGLVAALTTAFVLLPEFSQAEDRKDGSLANAAPTGTIAANTDRDSAVEELNSKLNDLVRKNKRQAELLAESRKQEADLREKIRKTAAVAQASNGGASNKPKKLPQSAHQDDFSTYQSQLLKDLGYSQETKPVATNVAASDGCTIQPVFVRSDPLDNYLYGSTPASKAKGASISYTDDRRNELQTLTVNGMVSYVLASNLCPPTPGNNVPFISGYAIAPFVNAQGNFTQPEAKTERSALQFGTEAEFEVSQFILPRQVFTIAPFYQTDFREIARIGGAHAYWDIFDPDLHLGGYVSTELEPNLGWFLQIRGELDARKVSTPGLTNLIKSDYEWAGGTARLNLFFFPYTTSVPEFVRNRFSFFATVSTFHDINSGQNILEYTAALAYKITTDGSSSISLEYDRGTNKDTLTFLNQYLLKLTYAL